MVNTANPATYLYMVLYMVLDMILYMVLYEYCVWHCTSTAHDVSIEFILKKLTTWNMARA